MQANAVPRVPIAAAQPGDLLFYYSPISHVGIYLGNGQLVHSPNSSTHVKVSNVNWSKVVVVGRPG
jgi:cell wall-associated NlpC family hydrolase